MARSTGKTNRLDEIDIQILQVLVDQGRISNASLARSVGLSESATLERVRRLEKNGIIKGYSARVIPEALGRSARAIAHLRITNKSESTRSAIWEQIVALDFVVAAYAVMGTYDLAIHLAALDLQELDKLTNSKLALIDGIEIVETLMVTHTLCD